MTKESLAALLTGREIGSEITEAEESQAKEAGLVVVFGASDDLIEFRGAINDESDCWDGGTILVDNIGVLPDWDSVAEDEESAQDYFARKRGKLIKIEALWCKEPDYSWTYKTSVPHSTFEIVEDGGKYCRGIVFNLQPD